jgi:hypothetical protein
VIRAIRRCAAARPAVRAGRVWAGCITTVKDRRPRPPWPGRDSCRGDPQARRDQLQRQSSGTGDTVPARRRSAAPTLPIQLAAGGVAGQAGKEITVSIASAAAAVGGGVCTHGRHQAMAARPRTPPRLVAAVIGRVSMLSLTTRCSGRLGAGGLCLASSGASCVGDGSARLVPRVHVGPRKAAQRSADYARRCSEHQAAQPGPEEIRSFSRALRSGTAVTYGLTGMLGRWRTGDGQTGGRCCRRCCRRRCR